MTVIQEKNKQNAKKKLKSPMQRKDVIQESSPIPAAYRNTDPTPPKTMKFDNEKEIEDL